ncbi:hypothetical protein N9P99_00465 [Planktomarina temperata]|nr:hypothetical protein [Planktomarina temperata]
MIDRLSIALLVIILTGCGGGGGGGLGSSISGSSAEAPTISIVHRTSRFPNLGILAQDSSDVSYAIAVTDFNRTTGPSSGADTVYYDESSMTVGYDCKGECRFNIQNQYSSIIATSANNIGSLPVGEFTYLGTAVRRDRFNFPTQQGTTFYGDSELVINPTAGTGTLTADVFGTLNVSITGITDEGRLTGSGTILSASPGGVYQDVTFSGNLAGQNATEYSGVGVSDSFFIGAIGKR